MENTQLMFAESHNSDRHTVWISLHNGRMGHVEMRNGQILIYDANDNRTPSTVFTPAEAEKVAFAILHVLVHA